MNDTKLEKTIEEYKALAMQDKNVDVTSLMMNAFEQGLHQNVVTGKQKKWAYLISLSVPPFGLLFAAKYYFSDEDDAREVAWTCVILTVVSIALFAILMKALFAATGSSMSQIEQISPQMIQQTLQ